MLVRLLEAKTGVSWQGGGIEAGAGNTTLGCLCNQRFLLLCTHALQESQTSSNYMVRTIKKNDLEAMRTVGNGWEAALHIGYCRDLPLGCRKSSLELFSLRKSSSANATSEHKR